MTKRTKQTTGIKRWIIQRTMLVTHQSVVYAKNENEALAKFSAGDVEPEEKPFYSAGPGDYPGHIVIFEGSEQ